MTLLVPANLNSNAQRSSSSSPSVSSSKQLKSCSDCHTTRTPLWRGGPAGPKSLYNACGIKYNKKRRELLGLDRGRNDKGKKKRKSSSGGNKSNEGGGVGQSLRMKLMALGGEMVLRRSGKLMGKLREEEQAAILLMALSCGSVYA
nr:GATA transcription factor 16-like [Coffea arabica]